MLRFYGENEYIEDFYEVMRIFTDVETKEISLSIEKITNNPYKEKFTILADDLQIYNDRLIYSNIIDVSS